MKKADLAQKVQDELQGTRAQAERIVQMMFDAIAGELSKGGVADIAGFGKFEAKKRAAREARNPRTGATVKVAATMVPKFKASKTLKDAVAGK
ncbi:MAG: HU family DNA-binding protein [Candidatus Pacebacteria bacterium]|nr:HU family DNA-binding protein [Candidatus Paceibacterota bacterium]